MHFSTLRAIAFNFSFDHALCINSHGCTEERLLSSKYDLRDAPFSHLNEGERDKAADRQLFGDLISIAVEYVRCAPRHPLPWLQTHNRALSRELVESEGEGTNINSKGAYPFLQWKHTDMNM